MRGGRALPAVLGLAALALGAAALWHQRAPAPSPAAAGTEPPTPLLSARRVPAFLSRQLADTRLAQAVDQAFSDPALGPGRDRSCLLVDAPDGRVLYARQPSLALIPASNLKLVTAAAALARLGPASRFSTEVRLGAAPVGGVVAGDLWLVGGGDPLLSTADFAATAGYQGGPRLATPLESLADRVAAAGVRQVKGRVVGDEGRYDLQRYVPSWNPRYVTNNEIGPISALTVNGGFAQWKPKAVPAPAPATNAAAVFVALLQARGVVVVGGVGEGRTPGGTTRVAAVESPPLADVVGEMLRDSDNLTAEMLVKEMGVRAGGGGTTAAGVKVVTETVAGRGLPVAGLSAVDGSGLDRTDRGTCDLFAAVLGQGGEDGPLGRGLPTAGRDGTLARRFLGGPATGRIRAKTGSLEHVVALSGWATTTAGPAVRFSLVVNDLPRDAAGTALEDKLANVLVGYPQAPSAAELGPRR